MKTLSVLSILLVCSFQLNAFASGCDSDHFYSGQIEEQTTSVDIGELKPVEAQNLIQIFKRKFKNSLFYWSSTPIVVEPVEVKIVKTTYEDLDTDCGWSHYGSKLFITQLLIKSDDSIILYPDLFEDISAEKAPQSSDFIIVK